MTEALTQGVAGPGLALLWFLAAAAVLDFYDISLPRGDSVGIAGALFAAAIGYLGPWWTLAIALGSAMSVHVARRGLAELPRLVTIVAARGSAIAIAFGLLRLLPSTFPLQLSNAACAASFLAAELFVALFVESLVSHRKLRRLLRGNFESRAPLLAAQWSASMLLMLTYGRMGVWSLVPVVALLLLMRQSFSLFLDIRETYRTTVEVLVEAAESQDSRRVGHAERTAALAREVAAAINLSPRDVERISYAALLHDIGQLAQAPSPPSPGQVATRASSAEVVREVEFFRSAVPVLQCCDGVVGTPLDDDVALAAMIVALAGDIDSESHPGLADAHGGDTLSRVSPLVPSETKARVVGAALRLGYRIPAVR